MRPMFPRRRGELRRGEARRGCASQPRPTLLAWPPAESMPLYCYCTITVHTVMQSTTPFLLYYTVLYTTLYFYSLDNNMYSTVQYSTAHELGLPKLLLYCTVQFSAVAANQGPPRIRLGYGNDSCPTLSGGSTVQYYYTSGCRRGWGIFSRRVHVCMHEKIVTGG